MSTTLAILNRNESFQHVSVTRFSGGVKRGLCVQLTRSRKKDELEKSWDVIDLSIPELNLIQRIMANQDLFGDHSEHSPDENIFFITIASNQPFGCGHFRIYANTQEDAEKKAFAAFGDRWSFSYKDLEKIHELDRTEHGVIF